ncbi:MAG: hypothetical protein FJ100_17295 [Deltaproteobacteria bacterium]|nr:hypothetical protein [Deltaproteobacteria bacterium]
MSTPFSSGDTSQIGAKCDGSVPKNCPKGESIKFSDTGECICIIGCGHFNPAIPVGGDCSKDGKWKCLEIVSTNGSNKMKACVNTTWNLCHTGAASGSGGSDAGSTGSDTTSPPKDTAGPTCKQAGASCEVNSECCSKQCDPDFGDCQ